MRSDRQPERRQPGPAGQSGTCSGSSAAERPCQRGLRAGSIPAPSTKGERHTQQEREMPTKTSNVRGVMRVVIPMADRCNGRGVMVAELTPDTDITPAAVPSKAKYKVTEIDPSRWGE